MACAVALVPAGYAAAQPAAATGTVPSATTAAGCTTMPSHLPGVPTPEAFLGQPLGTGQTDPVTTTQIQQYVAAIDASSSRVVSGTMTRSVEGQALPYAIVSDPGNVKPAQLKKIAALITAMRDPRTLSPEKAAAYAKDLPAIVWIAGNVHGGEKSGGDAALKTLYELAAGKSCDVKKRLDNLVTVIVPTQNPDGRDATRRQNDYGFDLNRDWFARTQVETDGKVEMLRRYPAQVFIDAHEMGGKQYFFPPNADPIHHEIADQPVDWINRIGDANKAAFSAFNGACSDTVTEECYFNYQSYDLFYMGYGDTVPTTGFGAAGMTYEKGSVSSTQDRVQQQFATQWATTGWAAANKREVLRGYYNIWKKAITEGTYGNLEPNEVVQPTNTVQFPVPDVKVRSYFLLPDRQLGDVRALVERLRKMDVEVYKVDKALTVPDAKVFGGRSAKNMTVPAGSYWIPMNQPQKHWIQATLGEDPYVPFPYFYDVSSWSNPLLMGINAIYTGDRLAPKATRVSAVDGGVRAAAPKGGSYAYPLDSAAAADLTFELLGRGTYVRRSMADGTVNVPAWSIGKAMLDRLATAHGVTVTATAKKPAGTPLRLPDVGLYAGEGISTTSGSYGEARYVLGERWGLTPSPVSTADINDNTAAFTGRQVLIVPDGRTDNGGLTAQGMANLKAWAQAGGVYVGVRNEGTRVARAAGLTSTTEKIKPADYTVIGSHFRVDADTRSPVALGRPGEDFEFNNSDPILTPSTTGTNVLTYPSDGSFWSNGYTIGADLLKGSVALVDEPTGAGHAVLFAYNPLFRAYNESGLHLLANSLLLPASGKAPTADSAATQTRRAAAKAAAEAANVGGDWRPITVRVKASDLRAAEALVRGYTGDYKVSTVKGSGVLVIANRSGLSADEHPFLRDMVRKLNKAGVTPQSVVG